MHFFSSLKGLTWYFTKTVGFSRDRQSKVCISVKFVAINESEDGVGCDPMSKLLLNI